MAARAVFAREALGGRSLGGLLALCRRGVDLLLPGAVPDRDNDEIIVIRSNSNYWRDL